LILGIVSQNKELFLFDRHIEMSKRVEHWLLQVENTMKETTKKLLKNAIEKFNSESLEDWVMDYP